MEAAIGVLAKTTQVRYDGETKTLTIFGIPTDSEALKQINKIREVTDRMRDRQFRAEYRSRGGVA